MRASVPHDVDLEDQLLYGLTPIRFGYLVVAVLCAMGVWGQGWLPLAVRLVLCPALIAAAVVLAWGRWRGRRLDRLVVDVGIFLRRNYRLQVGPGPPRRARSLPPAKRPSEMATIRFAAINDLGRRRSGTHVEGAP